jgi:hypothetical protein
MDNREVLPRGMNENQPACVKLLVARMRMARALLVGLGIAGAFGWSRAQPKQELGAALDQLLEAGNYTWEEKRELDTRDGKTLRLRAYASGETSVGGYTSARLGRVHAVMLDRETAFALQKGWRHFQDLTDDEIAELRAQPAALAGDARTYVHPLAHELLGILVRAAHNVRKEGGVLVADIDAALLDRHGLERYLRHGALPGAPPTRTIFGLPVPAPGRTRLPSAAAESDDRVIFFVWADQGKISRLSVEFWRKVTFANGPRAGDQDLRQMAYIMELSNIGTTTVDVAPEAKALFLGKPGGR